MQRIRSKFSHLLDVLGVKQPPWKMFSNLEESKRFANTEGYPVLVRPSYVLSGAAMKVIWSETQLEQFILEGFKCKP